MRRSCTTTTGMLPKSFALPTTILPLTTPQRLLFRTKSEAVRYRDHRVSAIIDRTHAELEGKSWLGCIGLLLHLWNTYITLISLCHSDIHLWLCDYCPAQAGAITELYPEATIQHCVKHFDSNIEKAVAKHGTTVRTASVQLSISELSFY